MSVYSSGLSLATECGVSLPLFPLAFMVIKDCLALRDQAIFYILLCNYNDICPRNYGGMLGLGAGMRSKNALVFLMCFSRDLLEVLKETQDIKERRGATIGWTSWEEVVVIG